jgi:hypothetical protein
MIETPSPAAPFPFSFDRAPAPALVEALVTAGGPLAFITELVRGDNLWDLGFRGNRVDVYRGRCVVLQIEANDEAQLSLMVESPKFRKTGFDAAWKAARPAAELESLAPAIREYLKAVSLVVNTTFTSGKAVYQGALTHHRLPSTPGVIVVDREAVLGWTGTTVDRDAALKRPRHSYERLAGGNLGKEADALAVSTDGATLFVVEVNSDTKLMDKAVAQVSWSAALFRWWVARDPELASQTIEKLATARRALGLSPQLAGGVKIESVVPVIALPRSAGTPSASSLAEATRRLGGALGHDGTVPSLWELDSRTVRV